MKQFLILLIGLTLFISCEEDRIELQDPDVSQQLIDDYLAANNLTAEVTNSGLNYIITEEGEGTEMPTLNSTVEVFYRGHLLNGEEFDASSGDPFRSHMSNLIPGWREGLLLFKKNGRGILLIPPHLGYGVSQTGSIPPNSVLVFEVELVGFFE